MRVASLLLTLVPLIFQLNGYYAHPQAQTNIQNQAQAQEANAAPDSGSEQDPEAEINLLEFKLFELLKSHKAATRLFHGRHKKNRLIPEDVSQQIVDSSIDFFYEGDGTRQLEDLKAKIEDNIQTIKFTKKGVKRDDNTKILVKSDSAARITKTLKNVQKWLESNIKREDKAKANQELEKLKDQIFMKLYKYREALDKNIDVVLKEKQAEDAKNVFEDPTIGLDEFITT